MKAAGPIKAIARPCAVEVVPVDTDAERVAQDTSTVINWLVDYVSEPAQGVARTGPVCPFVPPSLNAGGIRLRLVYGVDLVDAEHGFELLSDALSDFIDNVEPPGRSGSSLASVLVVFPDAVREGRRAIDRMYERLKRSAVEQGLMVGQFHQDCDERAVRNSAFRVSRSPITLVAIRHMAVHDVLFLHDMPAGLASYQARFADHYDTGRVRDPLMKRLYAEATSRAGRDEWDGVSAHA